MAQHECFKNNRVKVFTAKFPFGITSVWAKLLYGDNSCGEISLRQNFLTAIFPTAEFPTEKNSYGKISVHALEGTIVFLFHS